MPGRVACSYRRILAVGVQVGAEKARAVHHVIRRNGPMQFRIVIPAAQPVHPRLVVVDISAVAERVRVAQGVRQLARAAQLSAPRVVLVFYHNRTVRVKVLWHEKSPAGEVKDTPGSPLVPRYHQTALSIHVWRSLKERPRQENLLIAGMRS